MALAATSTEPDALQKRDLIALIFALFAWILGRRHPVLAKMRASGSAPEACDGEAGDVIEDYDATMGGVDPGRDGDAG